MVAANGQIVSTGAVVITVIYIARQFRDTIKANRTSAFNGDVANVISLNSLFITNPEFAELYLMSRISPDTLDELRVHLFMMAVFRHYDNVYVQYRIGAIDAELWTGWESTFKVWLSENAWRSWYADNSFHFSRALSELVERFQRDADWSSGDYRWR